MKQETLFYIFIIFIFCSCGKVQNTKEGKVRIGANDCYALDTNQRLVGLSEDLKPYYLPFAQLGKFQFPVNRVLISPKEKTFIALSLNGAIAKETMAKAHKNSTTITLIDSNDSTFLLKVDSLFNARFVRNIHNNTYLINIVTTDSAIADFYFKNETIIDEKIKCDF